MAVLTKVVKLLTPTIKTLVNSKEVNQKLSGMTPVLAHLSADHLTQMMVWQWPRIRQKR